MKLADFDLYQSVFEIRMPPAYMHWDRAGVLWTEIDTQIGPLKMVQATPQQTLFRKERTEFSVQIESASVNAVRPHNDLLDLSNTADNFFRTVADKLKIVEFKRIGCRLIYTKTFPSEAEACAALLSTGRLNPPQARPFGFSSPPIDAEWAFRWEDADCGVLTRLKIDTRKFEINAPIQWEDLGLKNKELITLTYDADWYTRAPVLRTQISFAEWIKRAVGVINKESGKLLGENLP